MPRPDFIRAGALFLVSPRLRGVLEASSVEAEFFPVEIVSGARVQGYFHVNLLGSVDCVDVSRSVFSSEGDWIDRFEKLVVDEEKAGGRSLLRVARVFDDILLAGEAVVSSVRLMGMTGVQFVTPEDWVEELRSL